MVIMSSHHAYESFHSYTFHGTTGKGFIFMEKFKKTPLRPEFFWIATFCILTLTGACGYLSLSEGGARNLRERKIKKTIKKMLIRR